MSINSSSSIGRDGSFHITGLGPGKAGIGLIDFNLKEVVILRIEHNGIEVRDEIPLGPGEQISGVRVVIGFGSGAVHGQLKVEGGQLEEVIPHVIVSLTRNNVYPNFYRQAEIDARGRFKIEKLVAGDYELAVGPRPMSAKMIGDADKKILNMPTVRQIVNVKPGAESTATLVLPLKP